MKADTTTIKETSFSTNIKNNINEQPKINLAISENYQVFLSLIFFIIGCSLLFYLFSFVFSVYVSYNNLFFLV